MELFLQFFRIVALFVGTTFSVAGTIREFRDEQYILVGLNVAFTVWFLARLAQFALEF